MTKKQNPVTAIAILCFMGTKKCWSIGYQVVNSLVLIYKIIECVYTLFEYYKDGFFESLWQSQWTKFVSIV